MDASPTPHPPAGVSDRKERLLEDVAGERRRRSGGGCPQLPGSSLPIYCLLEFICCLTVKRGRRCCCLVSGLGLVSLHALDALSITHYVPPPPPRLLPCFWREPSQRAGQVAWLWHVEQAAGQRGCGLWNRCGGGDLHTMGRAGSLLQINPLTPERSILSPSPL